MKRDEPSSKGSVAQSPMGSEHLIASHSATVCPREGNLRPQSGEYSAGEEEIPGDACITLCLNYPTLLGFTVP